jgi:hypothetical protein
VNQETKNKKYAKLTNDFSAATTQAEKDKAVNRLRTFAVNQLGLTKKQANELIYEKETEEI